MSNKNRLIEQAALSSIGLQEIHVYGILGLWVLVMLIFACLRLKKATWTMLLVLNLTSFAYAMKLTIASGIATGKGEPMIGPDGTEYPPGEEDEYSDDDDDEEEEEEEEEEEPKPVGEIA